ncbi:ABC transporter ATP-binding protein [Shimia sp. CNT1-13L.2]|uniref:ABC transporter ATP-binding protein n=1 Tax=Shimia sp. CNT1-13L.2 TaxID=2959663 RepID=UPI0020CF9EC7|nr:ABC transporter ATP-binding protein [Shimia sp. CNT1-13L.2]MCP9483379.1 ABC transporter ATP-binding protein [Shimia sp. CNT1-13L.2]
MTNQDTQLLKVQNLQIEGLSEDRWKPIVKGVDLTLAKGEVLGLIGESGAGKSTIGLGAMGYVRDGCRFSGGSVEFDGVDLTKADRETRRNLRSTRIAYVAQSAAASFNPAFKLINQHTEFAVRRGVMSRDEAQRDAIDLYRQLQLPNPDEIGFRYPHQVSGGQLQRAMTAMAMACRPDLIIFDEPTTALDVTTQIEVLSAIREIVEEFGTSAIYITHDLAVVAQMADRIMVLRHGNEVESADTETMLNAPQEDYTKSLWAVRSFTAEEKPEVSEDAVPVVSLKNVTAQYPSMAQPVLNDISMSFYPGRTVAVVGESGSGKSTTARSLMGLLPPISGDILLNGEPLAPQFRKRSKAELKSVQMIYQMADTALNPKQRIRDIIGRPMTYYRGLKGKALTEETRALLADIELEPDQYMNRLPSELSGGQKQRIGIARALAAAPQLVICDEVTSALDQLVAEGILRLLDKLQKEHNLAYMFITHDISTVRAIADEVVVMQHGKIVEQGPKNAIFSPPHALYTDLLLSSVPEMDPTWLDRVLADRVSEAARAYLVE